MLDKEGGGRPSGQRERCVQRDHRGTKTETGTPGLLPHREHTRLRRWQGQITGSLKASLGFLVTKEFGTGRAAPGVGWQALESAWRLGGKVEARDCGRLRVRIRAVGPTVPGGQAQDPLSSSPPLTRSIQLVRLAFWVAGCAGGGLPMTTRASTGQACSEQVLMQAHCEYLVNLHNHPRWREVRQLARGHTARRARMQRTGSLPLGINKTRC